MDDDNSPLNESGPLDFSVKRSDSAMPDCPTVPIRPQPTRPFAMPHLPTDERQLIGQPSAESQSGVPTQESTNQALVLLYHHLVMNLMRSRQLNIAGSPEDSNLSHLITSLASSSNLEQVQQQQDQRHEVSNHSTESNSAVGSKRMGSTMSAEMQEARNGESKRVCHSTDDQTDEVGDDSPRTVASQTRRTARRPVTIITSECPDPLLDDHFRRSLGVDRYNTLFNREEHDAESASDLHPKAKAVESPKTTLEDLTKAFRDATEAMDREEIKKFEDDMKSDSAGFSVEDHFAKALGDQWTALQNDSPVSQSNKLAAAL